VPLIDFRLNTQGGVAVNHAPSGKAQIDDTIRRRKPGDDAAPPMTNGPMTPLKPL